MLRFLIADDHPMFRDALSTIVARAFVPCELIEAGDVEQIYRALDQHAEIDLLLLDLAMPGARGFSALIALRAQFPALPIAMVSGRADPMTVARALAHGAAGFVPKSADAETLTGAIKQISPAMFLTPSVATPSASNQPKTPSPASSAA